MKQAIRILKIDNKLEWANTNWDYFEFDFKYYPKEEYGVELLYIWPIPEQTFEKLSNLLWASKIEHRMILLDNLIEPEIVMLKNMLDLDIENENNGK